MTNLAAWAALAAISLLSTGCGGATKGAPANPSNVGVTANQAKGTGAATGGCAPGSPVLAITKLCQEQANALLLSGGDPQEAAPEGCQWVVNEAKMLDGALLYRGLRCGDRTAQLEFTPGARAASFDLVGSPFGAVETSDTIAVMIDADRPDPHSAILEAALRVIEDPAERRRCQVRALNGDVAAPSDALVVDEVPIPRDEEVRSACGEFGFDGGSQAFWRVSQKVAWFFSLGNDTPPVDASSFTLIARDAAGQWVRS
jgi:hypothetical protein